MFAPLIAALPVVWVADSAPGVFSGTDSARPLLILLAAGFLTQALLAFASRSWHTGGLLAGFLSTLLVWLSGYQALALVFVTLLFGAHLMCRRFTAPKMTLLLNIYFASVFVQAVVGYAWSARQLRIDDAEVVTKDVVDAIDYDQLALRDYPSIIHIVLDGYANGRIQRQLYGFDTTAFESELKALGFVVLPRTRSPFSQTLLTMSAVATGSQTLLQAPAYAGLDVDQLRSVLGALMTDGPLVRFLDENGYTIGIVPNGYAFFRTDPDHRLQNREATLGPNGLESHLLGTWFSNAGGYIASLTHNRLLRAAFDPGEALAMPRPFYCYQHIIAPHPPFTITAEGGFRRTQFVTISDGSHAIHGDEKLRQAYIRGYVEKAKFAQSATLSEVRLVLDRMDTPMVIIVHGDHGGGAYYDAEKEAETCHAERFSPFLAVYSNVPAVTERFQTLAAAEFNLVNLYRALFAALGAEGMDLLDGRSAYASWSNPQNPVSLSRAQLSAACATGGTPDDKRR